MPQFIAVTSRGLNDVLSQELTALGLKVTGQSGSGVSFEASWEGCYKANLQLRTATRVIKPILDFPAYQPEELYNNVKKHDFTKYIDLNQTFAIDSNVRESSFRDQRFVTLKIKDAIADQFRDKFGERPNVDGDNPDLRVMARVVKNQVSLSIDTSGGSLSQRGYRIDAGEAPLREHLAAGLIMMAGWDKNITIVDPMCGSGTFLIEAAMMARNMAPGLLRKKFGFQSFKGFQQESWDKVVNEAMDQELDPPGFKLYGSDIDGKVLEKAKRNAERAGVEEDIIFSRHDIGELRPPAKGEKGLIIVNPPYGERLGNLEVTKDVYRDFAYVLKQHFVGWRCWLLSGNEDMTRALRLKASRKMQVNNGNIDCRFLHYEIKS